MLWFKLYFITVNDFIGLNTNYQKNLPCPPGKSGWSVTKSPNTLSSSTATLTRCASFWNAQSGRWLWQASPWRCCRLKAYLEILALTMTTYFNVACHDLRQRWNMWSQWFEKQEASSVGRWLPDLPRHGSWPSWPCSQKDHLGCMCHLKTKFELKSGLMLTRLGVIVLCLPAWLPKLLALQR